VQGLAVAASFLFAVWAAGLLATEQQRALAVATSLGVISVVVLTAALAPSHGAMGTAVAMCASEAVLAASAGFMLMRRRELRPNVAILPKVAFAAAAAGGLVLADLPDVVLVPAALVAYAVILRLVGGVPDDFRHLSLRRLRALRRAS
jgi:O-antigen/teichoic acid export membrane protein